ncbi:hypothetical protein L6452_15115 [Arctium lappa]|uniref:Uncharacterized protein n=1 Tax=Arctium lappa TaxID=4217 RepID=A0ACB9CMN9_ARCLA|nr:hypothetical protein L6452_15115 [Arctium lappa]
MALSPLEFVICSSWLLLIVILQNTNCANSVNPKMKTTILHTQSSDLGTWKEAHATFYGGSDGIDTMGGACGYADVMKEGYGEHNTALSTVMFNDGQTCGACYEIQCFNNSQWCKPDSAPITVTATNFCPPNPSQPNDDGGWCNPPREHFDLSQPSFLLLAEYKAGITPVKYRRVPCVRQGGIKFTISGNPHFLLVLVWNVGGAGDVTGLEVKGDEGEWNKMSRNWGQKWNIGSVLTGQSLSFKVHVSDGCVVECPNVAPKDWQFQKTYEGKNF